MAKGGQTVRGRGFSKSGKPDRREKQPRKDETWVTNTPQSRPAVPAAQKHVPHGSFSADVLPQHLKGRRGRFGTRVKMHPDLVGRVPSPKERGVA